MKQFLNNIQPHKFFLFVAITMGVIYNIVTPPLQVPDEYDHFRRVYHIADGHFLPEKNGKRLGGQMPLSFKEFVHPYRLAATNLKYTLNSEHYQNSFRVPLNTRETEFDDFPNTSYYSPVSYLPQALAVYVIKHFEVTNARLYYTGRIFIFLVWLVCMFFLIKVIPVCKWLFTFILLLPMNLYLSNSFSADTMTNILSFTFVVLCLKYAFDEKYFSQKRLIILLVIGILLALSKLVYVGLVFSFFVIPLSKFSSKKIYFTYASILIFCSFLAAWLWSHTALQYFTPYSEYDLAYRDFSCLSHCADYEGQKQYILSHGSYFLKVIYHSLFRHPYTYLAGYIGSFGNNDIPLARPILLISYVFIILLAVTERSEKQISLRQKFILVSAAGFSFVLLLLSQHLTWDCVGEGIVDVVQGRYFIPLFPMVFFLFSNSLPKLKINLFALLLLMVIIPNLYAFKIIYNRYTRESFVQKFEWECGAEELDDNNMFITSNDSVKLEGFQSRTDSISYGGKYCAKLSSISPYCFTYKFKNLNYGDLIEISAWQKGEGAQMIVSGKGKKCGEFYFPSTAIAFKGEDGWNRMHYAFTFNLKCELSDSVTVAFFVYNAEKTSTCIDNLKFSVKKFGYNYLEHKSELF